MNFEELMAMLKDIQAKLQFTSEDGKTISVTDALKMFPGPIIELHISNIHRREEIYRDSLMSRAATAVIMGLGPDGYPTAVAALVRRLQAA